MIIPRLAVLGTKARPLLAGFTPNFLRANLGIRARLGLFLYREQTMKSARFLIVMLVLLAPALFVNAEDNGPSAQDSDIKELELFNHVGGAWTYRHLQWNRGAPPTEWRSSHRIESVEDGIASVRYSQPRHPDHNRRTGTHAIDLDNIPESFSAALDPGLPRKTFTVGSHNLECVRVHEVEDGVHVTRWVSVSYHPLIVKESRLLSNYVETTTMETFDITPPDPFQLYRVQGRSWKQRTTMDMGGMGPMVHITRNEVVKVTDESATLRFTMLDGDGNEFASPTEVEIKFTDDEHHGGHEGAQVVLQRKEITTEAGTFMCVTHDGQIWSSEIYPGLMVKYDMGETKMELIEFNDGHEPWDFYGTVGNYVEGTLHMEPEGEGTFRFEVIRVEDDKTTLKIHFFEEMDEETMERDEILNTFTEDGELELVEEVTITIGAGTFACLKWADKNHDEVVWTYKGVPLMFRSVEDSIRFEATKLYIQ
jgi:hypothetical protein